MSSSLKEFVCCGIFLFLLKAIYLSYLFEYIAAAALLSESRQLIKSLSHCTSLLKAHLQ
jgi:hypothetical protein